MPRFINADEFAMSLISCEGLGRKSYEAVLKAIKDYPAVEMECNGDLISRSALIEKLEEKMFDSKLMCPVIKLTDLIELIDEQPKAYDVEKVVAELESKRDYKTIDNYYGETIGAIEIRSIDIGEAIEIVKAGGVE